MVNDSFNCRVGKGWKIVKTRVPHDTCTGCFYSDMYHCHSFYINGESCCSGGTHIIYTREEVKD